MEILIVALVLVAVLWLVAVWLGAQAKRQVDVDVDLPPERVAEIVRDHFGSITWRPVNGRGIINYQSRGPGVGSAVLKNPTISVDLSALVSGGTRAEIWMSSWQTKGGVIGSADRVFLKKRSLANKLAAL
ncbi:hypothetical protein C6A86_023655 [Mycobacterium sp. ITM-2016-00316]|uniref:hypothetical protein n=1 Tax=Mycobacterium sp. ITM-2016-00316 TaxID=2099695 RepID=UPI001159D1A8|nr:hypothetical protein [Mycobacterium sp. ITM-2016-00316]WNG81156.1 hypothetical protein C6A86_023655 [Mycobacterium sp. ITM-2016-00316]